MPITGWNLRDFREPRDFGRPWADLPGYFGPGWRRCNCCGSTSCAPSMYYAFGGNSTTLAGEKYTAATDSYAAIASGPSPVRDYASGASLNGKGYSFGGVNSVAFADVPDTDEYDPIGDAWTSKTDLPAPTRWDGGAAALGSFMYVYGGQHLGTVPPFTNHNSRYDPAGDSFSGKSGTAYLARAFGFGEVPGTKIMMVEGLLSTPSDTNQVRSYTEDAWAGEAADITHHGLDHGFFLGAYFFATGGNTGAFPDSYHRGYASSWIAKTDIPASGGGDIMCHTLDCTEGYCLSGTSPHFFLNHSWLDDAWTTRTNLSAQHWPCPSFAPIP